MLAVKGRKPLFLYLLSDDVGIMAGLDFEGAVIRPQIDRIGDAGNTSFIDLKAISDVVRSDRG